MAAYSVKLTLLSPISLASGQANVNLDTETVHDVYGLPYFPGKRLRGLLYESALEVAEMAELCGSNFLTKATVAELFHRVEQSAVRLVVPDFYLPDYEKMRADWQKLQAAYKKVISAEDVLEQYSSVRFQTSIDENGVTKDGSLHNIRVIDAGLEFVGKLEILNGEARHEQALLLALRNLQAAGSKRNRGFGKLKCEVAGMQLQQQVADILGVDINWMPTQAGSAAVPGEKQQNNSNSKENQKSKYAKKFQAKMNFSNKNGKKGGKR